MRQASPTSSDSVADPAPSSDSSVGRHEDRPPNRRLRVEYESVWSGDGGQGLVWLGIALTVLGILLSIAIAKGWF